MGSFQRVWHILRALSRPCPLSSKYILFGGFPGSLTSNILPEIFTRVEHEDWGRTRLSWEDCQEASTWCLLQLLRWFSIRTEAIVKLDEWLYQDLYNPPSSALGEQLWRNKGILTRVYWQSLANLCRCRVATWPLSTLNPIWQTSWCVVNCSVKCWFTL